MVLRSTAPQLAAVAVVLFLLGVLGAVVTPLAGDAAVLSALADARSPELVTAARLFTLLGDLWLVALVAAAVAMIVRTSPDAPRIHAVLLVAIGGSTLVVGALKLVIDRARPPGALVTTISAAYPSGHATRAAVLFGLLAWAWHRTVHRRARRVALGLLTGLVTTAIAVSRVYLGVHRPSEALVGVLIGASWVAAVLVATARVEPSADTGHR